MPRKPLHTPPSELTVDQIGELAGPSSALDGIPETITDLERFTTMDGRHLDQLAFKRAAGLPGEEPGGWRSGVSRYPPARGEPAATLRRCPATPRPARVRRDCAAGGPARGVSKSGGRSSYSPRLGGGRRVCHGDGRRGPDELAFERTTAVAASTSSSANVSNRTSVCRSSPPPRRGRALPPNTRRPYSGALRRLYACLGRPRARGRDHRRLLQLGAARESTTNSSRATERRPPPDHPPTTPPRLVEASALRRLDAELDGHPPRPRLRRRAPRTGPVPAQGSPASGAAPAPGRRGVDGRWDYDSHERRRPRPR